MQLIEGSAVSQLVDYSFGDHMGMWDTRIIGGFFKYSNATNQEFLDKAKEFRGKIMTLYCDNLSLYPRPVETDTPADKQFVDYLMLTNNLLALCSLLPENRFIIFTGQSDTPIDKYITIPYNVIKIYAVNALFNNDRIIPFPLGVQRQIGEDNRQKILLEYLEKPPIEPTKLLYINCGIERNPERLPLKEFENKDFATTRFDKDSKFFPYDRYNEFLDEIRDHKFIACPKGHGFDTHRIWESLYLRRVPVILDHPYFRRLLDGFPVLFIEKWEDITAHLLMRKEHLYQKARTMDLNKLALDKIFPILCK